MKIAFVWQGITKRKDHWRDGLWGAMQILEKKYDVSYYEPWDDIPSESVILYWEAPCTINGENSQHYLKIKNSPNKKILLFAGGPLKKEWVQGFDVLAVESEINEKECAELGIPYARAFGINTKIFKPLKTEKKYDTVTHGTCASWKRQWLVCQAMKEKALVFGQRQIHDRRPFDECTECNATVLEEAGYEEVNTLLNSAHVSVNCADFWGGGQRATLEAMACDIPVVVMTDSPKNREFVEEAGMGIVCDPNPQAIKEAVESLKGAKGGRKYVLSKWTEKHYADALCDIIQRYDF